MKKIIHFLILLVYFYSQNGTALSPYQEFKEGRFDLLLKTNFFKSAANFAADGSQLNLIDGNYFQVIDFQTQVRWQYFESLGLIAGFNVGASESSDPLIIRKNSTINRIDIGGDFLFWNSEIHETFFKIIYSHSLEKVEINTESVMNSDGAAELKPEIITRFNFGQIYPYFMGGLNYRAQGLSMLATYGAGIEFRFSEIGLGASILGRISVKDDDKTSTPGDRDNVLSKVNAGSKKYYSINPNSTDAELNLNFLMDSNLLLKFFTGYTLAGSNSAHGYNVGLSLNFDMSTNLKNSSRSIKKKNATEFKEDTNDGVNQEYFKPVVPNNKEYIQQVEGDSQSLQNSISPEDDSEQIQIKTKSTTPGYKIKLKKKKKSK